MKGKAAFRVLLYKGPEGWLQHTMEHNAVQKGVFGEARGGAFSIQEVQFPAWVNWVLMWLVKRQPMARIKNWGGK